MCIQYYFYVPLVLYTIELGYNDLGLGDTSAVVLHILWHWLIPHKAVLFCLAFLMHKNIYLRYNDMPVISFNRIFQAVGYLWEFNPVLVLDQTNPLLFHIAT